jgi:hypothetical protein
MRIGKASQVQKLTGNSSPCSSFELESIDWLSMVSVSSSTCSISRTYTCLAISRAKLPLHLSVSCGARMVLAITMFLCLHPTPTRWGIEAIGLDAHNECVEMMHLPIISQPNKPVTPKDATSGEPGHNP